MGSSSTASIVIGLTGTGNSMFDDSFVGMFATGQQDGTVVWMCGTSAAATSTSVSAQTQLYPYLPAECQR
jgi:type IV pilus assembly protein PilA